MQNSAPIRVYLYKITPKFNRYACSKSPRRLSLGPIRESLPNQSPSGSPRPRNLRIRVQGKTRAKQKEIGNRRIIREIPYLCRVFLPTYRPHGILTAAPGSPGAVFYRKFGVVFSPPFFAAMAMITAAFCSSFGATTLAYFSQQSNKK